MILVLNLIDKGGFDHNNTKKKNLAYEIATFISFDF